MPGNKIILSNSYISPKTNSQLINKLTVKYEYSRNNRANLPLPIQMQLSKKRKTFCGNFIAFLESTLNFEHFENKISFMA